MLAKVWKKLLLAVLIVACMFNVVNKIVKKNSLKQELQLSAEYVSTKNVNNNNK